MWKGDNLSLETKFIKWKIMIPSQKESTALNCEWIKSSIQVLHFESSGTFPHSYTTWDIKHLSVQ